MRLPLLNFAHERWREQLSAYLDDRLAAREGVALQRHLANCNRCRTELEQLQATVALLRQVPVMALPRSFALRPVDLAAVEEHWPNSGLLGPGLFSAIPFRGGLRLATGIAALLFVGLVTYDLGATVMPAGSAAVRAIPALAPAAAPAPADTSSPVLSQKAAVQDAAAPMADRAAAPSTESAPSATASGAAGAAPPPQERAPARAGSEGAVGTAQGAASSADETRGKREADAPGSNIPPAIPASGPRLEYRAEDDFTARSEGDRTAGPIGPQAPVPLLRLLEGVLGAVVVAGGAALWWGRRRAP